MSQEAPTEDTHELAGFGYRQKLDRTLGSFSSFAVGFSYLSILTGLPQLFYMGYAAGGPAFFWTWPAVFFGQFMVALCFAELAARYPLSGGVYQWSKHIGSAGVGWMAGWVYLACSGITLAAVALALQITLPQLWPGFQIIGSAANPDDAAKNAVLLGCILIVFSTVVNSVGVRLLSRINNAGVFAEIVGAILLVGLMAFAARRGPAIVLNVEGLGEGRSLGILGAFLAAALPATYVMYGFDTAGSLAEETDNPRRRAPRAILLALGSVGLVGALLIVTALCAVENPADPQLGLVSGGMPYVIKQVLGDRLGRPLLCLLVVAITVCTLTVHAAAVRLMFAMARDNNLPFSETLAHISETSRTPTWPAVFLGACAILMLVVNVNYPQVIEVMASVAIVWANLAYLMVTAPLLSRRLRKAYRGAHPHHFSDAFSMGRWGLPVNLVAVAWGIFVIVNLSWPRTEIYGTDPARRYSAPLATAAMLLAGGSYYWLVRRHKTGVLETHRAPVTLAPATMVLDPEGGERG
ncbi:amino acid permease [Tautonia sp. JC769]|uniref:amino acid permease n=1 Tax=Tautonia sp. JC769 TaxID=3232135 RepID=UPI0034581AF1